MSADEKTWYAMSNAGEIASPALLVYPDRVEENVRRMIAMAGGVERLRPHVKTHKLSEVIRIQMAQGITKFKCATIAEAETAASCGAADVLLAYQAVGPNIGRLIELARRFSATKFSTIVDDAGVVRELSRAFLDASITLEVLLDIDCGMHRTGVAPGPAAEEIYRLISSLPALKPGGLHAYDGHIHDSDLAERTRHCEESFAPVLALRQGLIAAGCAVPKIVAGGTPTLRIHLARIDVECSPGTCIFWDAGYAARFPDLEFLPAALVFTRVISKPGGNRLCLDLGHKAIASENPHPRVLLLDLPEAKFADHSEEHLVIESERAGSLAVGDCLFGIPWHICPTVALHSDAVVVKNGHAEGRWKVVARQRRITV
jgi:D-threonine aldolase